MLFPFLHENNLENISKNVLLKANSERNIQLQYHFICILVQQQTKYLKTYVSGWVYLVNMRAY